MEDISESSVEILRPWNCSQRHLGDFTVWSGSAVLLDPVVQHLGTWSLILPGLGGIMRKASLTSVLLEAWGLKVPLLDSWTAAGNLELSTSASHCPCAARSCMLWQCPPPGLGPICCALGTTKGGEFKCDHPGVHGMKRVISLPILRKISVSTLSSWLRHSGNGSL